MANNLIYISEEKYREYIGNLRSEVESKIKIRKTPDDVITNNEFMQAWVEYANACIEIAETLTALEDMLTANTNDFEKSAEFLIVAGGGE